MRDFPKEITIKGVVWRVRFRRRLFCVVDGKRHHAFGLCHRDKRLIEVAMGMSPSHREEIFVHEVLHAIAWTWGFRLEHRTVYNLQAPLAELLWARWEALAV